MDGGNLAAVLLQIALTLQNPLPFARTAEPVVCGVPLARGFVRDAGQLRLAGPNGDAVPLQVQVTGKYADGTPRWVLLTFLADVPARGKSVYLLTGKGGER